MAFMAALMLTVTCLRAAEHLPAAFVPLDLVFRERIDFAAVCIAEEEPRVGQADHGTLSVTQRFRLLGLVVGRSGGRSLGEVRYRVSSDGSERAVGKDERVIWLGRCEQKMWAGVHVVSDTPENRNDIYSRVAYEFRTEHDPLEVSIEATGDVFARGQPIPIRVQIDNTSDSTIALWSNFSALQFAVLAEDGEPIKCRTVRRARFDRTEPLLVGQYHGPIDTADLADLCDWLPSGEQQRSYTLLWRGKARIGDRKAEPLELISQPIRLTVRDPSTLAWGADGEGVVSGLAAERHSVSMGDRMMFHFGVKSDSVRADANLYIYRYFPNDDEVHFTFRNIQTETIYERAMDTFQGGPAYSPKPEDFFHLQDQPVLLWTVPVRLLHESGEQIPAGTYEVTATYESRHPERTSCLPESRPWMLYRGPLVSAPVTVRVQHADPESVEIRTNSRIVLSNDEHGACFWTGSQEAPTILRLTKRPGFAFHVNAVTSVALGDGDFQQVSEGGYGGRFTRDRFVSATWDPGFPHGLGSEACRALAAGESLRVRVDVTMYETADTYGRYFSPVRGDSRLVWHGRLEARRP
jgi:hypothetical protein